MSDSKSTSRNSNIELLRILATVGVIVLHYNYEGIGGAFSYVAEHSINEVILYFFECACIISVNVFVLISGYYLSLNNSRTLYKPLRLLFQLLFYVILFYLINRFVHSSGSVNDFIDKWFSVYWFVGVYIALYFVSPFINFLIDNMKSRNVKVFIIVLFILFSVEPTVIDLFNSLTDCNLVTMSFISSGGSSNGYSIVNMILVYSIGAYIRRNPELISSRSSMTYLLIYFLCVCIDSLIAFVSPIYYSYCNPIVIIEAVSLFAFFIRLEPHYSKIVNHIARNSFAVYLTHAYLLRYVYIAEHINIKAPLLMLHILVSCIVIYVAGWILGQMFMIITSPLFSSVKKRLENIKINISE